MIIDAIKKPAHQMKLVAAPNEGKGKARQGKKKMGAQAVA